MPKHLRRLVRLLQVLDFFVRQFDVDRSKQVLKVLERSRSDNGSGDTLLRHGPCTGNLCH